jgi:hypothetical protein
MRFSSIIFHVFDNLKLVPNLFGFTANSSFVNIQRRRKLTLKLSLSLYSDFLQPHAALSLEAQAVALPAMSNHRSERKLRDRLFDGKGI